MGGLGNGRRGGRSPPLMIGALVAVILVLGFNYWVSSSRNLELQTKMYELEGQVRRGAAERGAADMKKNELLEEIQRQKEQIGHIESLYKRQLEGAQNTCSQEKGTLQQNITSSTKTIQDLKGQKNQLNEDLGKLQKELQSCQGNIKTLNNKLTYDMTQCHSQVLSQKELCDERIAAVKLEVQKKMEKLGPPLSVPSKGNALGGPIAAEDDPVKTSTVLLNQTTSVSQPKETEAPELLTNEIIVNRDADGRLELSPVPESQSVPPAATVKQDTLPPPEGDTTTVDAATSRLLTNNLTEEKKSEGTVTQDVDAESEESDPGMEGMLIDQTKADQIVMGDKLDDADEYDADEPVLSEVDLDKQQQNKRTENIDLEEELADYNGDDENEGEFEADKQAELAQI